jgi:hydrogenase expression/formation protein HypE
MRDDIIILGHGSGGKLSHQLLDELIIPTLSGIAPKNQNDAAILEHNGGRLAFTTDSYVVDPIFFPGGNIGDLAINGTVNDLAMCGATPLAISVGLIIEEGLLKEDLRKILASMRKAAEAAKVRIVTGDTKVVPRGKADKIFINTSGIGIYKHDIEILGSSAKVGDRVLINGTIGDHGIAILSKREGLALETTIESDSASLSGLVEQLIEKIGDRIHVMRDPTRGGVATTLNEIANQSEVDILLKESSLPLRNPVRGVCAILGLEPLFVANEGKMLAIVAADAADTALELMRAHPQGKEAAIIGEVVAVSKGKVMLETAIGGRRAVDMLSGEQLPRIC